MEYEYDDFSIIVPNYLLNSAGNIDVPSVQENEEGSTSSDLEQSGEVDVSSGLPNVLSNTGDNNIDYTQYFESIDNRLETLTIQVSEVRDNTYRLYYFIGGMYVVFAIVLAIKFFKQFF